MTWRVVGSALGPFVFSLFLDYGDGYFPAALAGRYNLSRTAGIYGRVYLQKEG